MRYVEVSAQEIESLRPALNLLERINHESGSEMADYMVYGLTSNPNILEEASRTLLEWDEERNPVTLTAIAISIPLSSDFLYYLTGSGARIKGLTFAHYSAQGEGVTTSQFVRDAFNEKVRLDDFTHLAVADGDSWIDDFLTAHARQSTEVQRDSEATLDDVAPNPQPGKQSSYEGLEDWFSR